MTPYTRAGHKVTILKAGPNYMLGYYNGEEWEYPIPVVWNAKGKFMSMDPSKKNNNLDLVYHYDETDED